ncbi:MAG TPA: hypothetical protein DIU37_01990 [Opitutae bacterium]|nr:hypothetical protein [Opitutae bacterium]
MTAPPTKSPRYDDVEPKIEWSELIHVWLFRAKLLLKRFWWVFLITISLGVAFQTYDVLITPPSYVSYSQMIVSGRIALPEGAIYSEELSNFFGTQMSLMQSHRVKERARLRVRAMQPELDPCVVRVSVSQSPDASIFILSAVGEKPEYTQAYLNALMNEYLSFKREMRSETADRTFLAITEEMMDLQKEIESGEDEKLNFQKENNIVFIQEQGSSVGAYLAELNQQLAELETQYRFLDTLSLDAIGERAQAVAELAKAKRKNNTEVVPAENHSGAALTSELYKLSEQYLVAKKELNLLKAQRDEYLTYMKGKHPKLAAVNLEIERKENEMSVLKRQALHELKDEKEVLQSKISHLKDVIDEQEVKALDYSRRLAEFERINSRLDRQKSLLENLTASIQSIDINLNLDQEFLTILENASPAYAVRISIVKNLVMGVVAGVFMGVGILFIISILDSRIISVEDVENRFDQPLMGIIPFQKYDGDILNPIKADDDRIIFAEACRNLRSSVLFGGDENEAHQVVAVTSSVPGEGKSTMAANLAVTLAFAGKKTLLLDADLRRGVLHNAFNVPNDKGLSDVIRERISFDDAIQRPGIENLDFVAHGTTTKRPGELLSGVYFATMLEGLRKRYDFIVFDLPPVLATDDTPGFVQKVDGVLFVVRSNTTRVKQAKSAFHILMFRRAKILGIVLNAFDVRGPGYYYHRYGEYYTRREEPSPKVSKKMQAVSKT